ncbi:hypothetical protein SAMN05414139_05271 [Burkholderia sp. D7]|nr:hypothetical protein SAMN05414139_05271 [Burkholderia sp. D7]
MMWSRLLGIMVLALLVSTASVVGIVMSFALVVRYFGPLTVWNEISPWATDTLDMIIERYHRHTGCVPPAATRGHELAGSRPVRLAGRVAPRRSRFRGPTVFRKSEASGRFSAEAAIEVRRRWGG